MQEKNLDHEFMRCLNEMSAAMNACIDYISMMQSKVLRDNYEYANFEEDEREQILNIVADYLDDMEEVCVDMLQISTQIDKEGK